MSHILFNIYQKLIFFKRLNLKLARTGPFPSIFMMIVARSIGCSGNTAVAMTIETTIVESDWNSDNNSCERLNVEFTVWFLILGYKHSNLFMSAFFMINVVTFDIKKYKNKKLYTRVLWTSLSGILFIVTLANKLAQDFTVRKLSKHLNLH